MAHFYSELQSTGATKTKTGTKASGIVAKAYSEQIGGSVSIGHDFGKDVVRVRLIEGSGYGVGPVPHAIIICEDRKVTNVDIDGYICIPYDKKATRKQREAIEASIRLILSS